MEPVAKLNPQMCRKFTDDEILDVGVGLHDQIVVSVTDGTGPMGEPRVAAFVFDATDYDDWRNVNGVTGFAKVNAVIDGMRSPAMFGASKVKPPAQLAHGTPVKPLFRNPDMEGQHVGFIGGVM